MLQHCYLCCFGACNLDLWARFLANDSFIFCVTVEEGKFVVSNFECNKISDMTCLI